MELTGEKTIDAPPEAVWDALIDPAFLSRLIPGCEAMTGSPERGYDITVARKVGSMEARMTGRFALSEVVPGRGCFLSGAGEAGAVGNAKGTARIRLLPEGDGTRLGWNISAELSGKLAAVPEFLVNMAARKVADGFVERFGAAIEGREPGARKGWLGKLSGR
jgi:carbon monoxide dehydrogenase subunit G